MNARLFLRFLLPLLGVLLAMAAILTPVSDNLIARWFQYDVQVRSQLIFNSIQAALITLSHQSSQKEMQALFERIATDERVMAVGWCDGGEKLRTTSKAWPKGLTCQDVRASIHPKFRVEEYERGTILMAAFPISTNEPSLGRLLILHDMRFAADRAFDARLYLMAFLVLLGLVVAAVTVLMARLTLRGWIRSVRHSLEAPLGSFSTDKNPDLAPVIGEIRQLLRDLDISRRTATGIRVDWSEETLRRTLEGELPNVQVIAASNREPYIHNRDPEGNIMLQHPASGVVTALEPIMQACQGVWIAHGSGTADRDTVDGFDRIAVPPDEPRYALRRVWLTDQEQAGYYYGFANEGLWALCHITFVRPVFRESDWKRYEAVNRKFAEAIVAESSRPDPIVLVQDYHFALVPRMVREKLPQATIVAFWHIPWPNSEVFGICPWREKILDGLLGSSVIGFQTQLHCNNFIETADRLIECHIDRERATVSVGGHAALVRPYPISIAWPPTALKHLPPASECRAAVFARYKLPADTMLGVGVERLDFTKGIPDRFRAIGLLFERYPEWIGRFVLIQAAAPSRSELAAYQEIQRESADAAEEINTRFGRTGYKPIILVAQHHEPEQVFELFRAADVAIVSSLHDGMNLVAKEFVAARDDEQGVLILSSFSGASRELLEALIVNPFDARVTADAIDRALRMSPNEKRERIRLMRELVSENNIYYWAGRMLLDASRLRKRNQIEADIAAIGGG